ncbi:MAG: redoxin family protein [Acidobacteriota bacterium]|nr:redoxin family protein [Acidobacteriota bacterium]
MAGDYSVFRSTRGVRWGTAALLLAILATVTAPGVAQRNGSGALVRLDGTAVGSELFEGNVIAVFFATWSPRCRDVVERANDLHKVWGGRARVVLVDFQESESEVRRFLGEQDSKVDVLLDRDGSFSKRHGVTTLPTLLVLESGSVAFKGRLPADADSILRPILN